MSYELDLTKVILNLRAVKEDSGCFPEDIFSRCSSGVKYLFENVLLPILHEKTVDSTDLDFTRFERQEVLDIWNIYLDTLAYNSKDRRSLEGIYDILVNAEAKTCTVGYI